jgi:uncharacterized integral membrane protein
MPWRLIQFIVVFAIFLLFITFNLENKCDINFGFVEFNDVPVFVTVFSSFIVGLLCVFPYIFRSGLRKKTDNVQGKGLLKKITAKKEEQAKTPDAKDAATLSSKDYGID